MNSQPQQPQPPDHPELSPAPTKPRRPGRIVRCYRRLRGLLALLMLLEIVLVFTPLTEVLYNWLDVTKPPVASDVIVCLGGRATRVVKAATVFHAGYAPKVIVTNRPLAAEDMRDLMVDCGVPADRILVDDTSNTTADHPAGIARLPGIDPEHQRFLIITDDNHSRRAAACFRKAGYKHFSVYAARFINEGSAAGYDSARNWRWRIFAMPNLLYEYAALLKYRVTGKI